MIYSSLPDEAYLKLKIEMSNHSVVAQNLYQPEYDNFYRSKFYGYVEVTVSNDIVTAEIEGKQYLPVRIIKRQTYLANVPDSWRKVMYLASKGWPLAQIVIIDQEIDLIEKGLVPFVGLYTIHKNSVNEHRVARLFFDSRP